MKYMTNLASMFNSSVGSNVLQGNIL